jgi:uncharacterized membrane protein (UPF0127 family)
MKHHNARSSVLRFRLFALLLLLSGTGIWTVLLHPAIASSAQDSRGDSKMVSLAVGGKTIRAVLADTDSTRIRGLLGWNSISEDTGMLLDFMFEGTYAIHMQGMKFPIDAIWIDSKGVVQWRYEDLQPNAGQIFPSMFPSRYCLEVAAGFCRKFGVKAGDKVVFAPAGR